MSLAVVDASAVVELVRDSTTGRRVAERISARDYDLHLPDHCPAEAASAFRGLVLGHLLTADRASQCVADLAGFPAEQHRTAPLVSAAWELRHNLTIYHALYVVLADMLDATLVTVDDKLDTPAVTRLVDVEVVH